jgi:hypothetical protein
VRALCTVHCAVRRVALRSGHLREEGGGQGGGLVQQLTDRQVHTWAGG